MEVQGTTKFEEEKHRISRCLLVSRISVAMRSDPLVSVDKDVHRTDRTVTFFAGDDLPNPDPDANTGTNANLETMKDILLTYVIAYNPDLGYVQGMSDLVAPIFVVMGDEAMTFWAFTHFMDRMVSVFVKALLCNMRHFVKVGLTLLHRNQTFMSISLACISS